MKKFMICLLGFWAVTAQASQTICSGKVWVTNAFAPIPLLRNLKVTIEPSLSEVTRATIANIEIDAGGDPVAYRGPVDLSGATVERNTDSANGDVMEFVVKSMPENHLEFEQQFLNSSGQTEGTLHLTTLTCE